jgi:hypothetical protein
VRETNFTGGNKHFSASKVPTQCPIALLVRVNWREGKALGETEDRALGNGLYC